MKLNELEQNVQLLAEAKVLNLDVSLATLVRGGHLSGLDPWDVFCGNGWIIRRRFPPIGPIADLDLIRNVVRDELRGGGFKG